MFIPDPLFQIKIERETDSQGVFVLEPLKQGYGNTMGNSLRRVLLTGLSGAAVSQIKIDGVKHKFSTLKGMKEDVLELILNIKQLRVKYSGDKPAKLTIDKIGPCEITAGDIELPSGVEIINKEFVLAHLADKKSHLKLEMIVEVGYGYEMVEDKKSDKIGAIVIDTAFSPVIRVNPRVESTRLGHRTDLDKLIIEIDTNGTIKPSEALKRAAEILMGYFNQLANPKIVEAEVEAEVPVVSGENYALTIEEVGLPTRIVNALRQAGYGTAGDLVSANDEDLARVKNLGQKSLEMIKTALKKKGVAIN